MAPDITIFDRKLVRRHRDRAAAGFAAHGFLFEEIAARVAERLDDVRRAFPAALDLGCRTGGLARALAGRGGIETLVGCDLSEAMVRRAGGGVAADAEALPFADGAFDLVVSAMDLHWVNDLPGALIQIRRALKPDGLFVAAMLGGDTLVELRRALIEGETEVEGGASPRTSPVADVRDAGALLQRAGFALPVVDSDTITVTYADAFALMRDLRGMAETNATVARRRNPTRRATLMAAAARYHALYAGADGRIPATFEVLTLTGWAPHAAQPRALRPGSAAARLADALEAEEKPAGDKPQP
ncbi:MAG: methyltransferase domain-containing protein [Rhodospirillales bacterium]